MTQLLLTPRKLCVFLPGLMMGMPRPRGEPFLGGKPRLQPLTESAVCSAADILRWPGRLGPISPRYLAGAARLPPPGLTRDGPGARAMSLPAPLHGSPRTHRGTQVHTGDTATAAEPVIADAGSGLPL